MNPSHPLRAASAFASALALVLAGAALAPDTYAAKSATDAASAAPPTIDARPWPRSYSSGGVAFTLHQPDLDVFEGNRIAGRVPMAVKVGNIPDEAGNMRDLYEYGVLWFSARTETDKEAREVTLHDVKVERASFPGAKDREAEFLGLARKVAPRNAQVVSLDQVESQLAIAQAGKAAESFETKNDPPEVVVSNEPTLLVRIDGEPKYRKTRFEGIERIVNSRALVARWQGKHYLHYGGRWARSDTLAGPWAALAEPPEALQDAYNQAVVLKLVAPQDEVPERYFKLFEQKKFPRVVVRTNAVELIEFDGDPGFEAIEGTNLTFAVNTPADVFVDAADYRWYVLLSGRWFRGDSAKGPWSHVAAKDLPADFAKIPGEHPKSAVLASIPGTPEATESLVSNSIPQTATVKRSEAKFEPRYDGDPEFVPIDGTSLHHARNSAVPVIQVSGDSYFGVENGVWFASKAARGPWTVATKVPPEIYRIPPSSPLHYVTYVKVYGSTDDVVYVGYTPGYHGTVVDDGVVVYGTGYECDSWVGDEWYACPETYGSGAAFGWSTAYGWGMSYCWGWYDPWCYPYWGPYWGYGYGYPYYGYGGAIAGNFYGRWGNTVIGGTGAAWANPWTGNYGRGFRGGYYNERTGAAGVGRGGSNLNVYTGNLTRAAQGVRYNPDTGRVTAGTGGSVRNIYTGDAAAAGRGTIVNTNTGRVTTGGGVAASGDQGAGALGGFHSSGAAGDISGIGYVRGDGEGNASSGGLVKVGDEVFAGKDGNIYHRGDDGSWEQVGNRGERPEPRTASELDRSAAARDRGYQREAAGDRSYDRGTASRGTSQFDRSSYNRSYQGSMGGYRGGSMGGMGGGMRGGGFGGGRRR